MTCGLGNRRSIHLSYAGDGLNGNPSSSVGQGGGLVACGWMRC
jgi:hypothetical protein